MSSGFLAVVINRAVQRVRGFKFQIKKVDHINVAKTKALISRSITVQLIFTFVFTCKKQIFP